MDKPTYRPGMTEEQIAELVGEHRDAILRFAEAYGVIKKGMRFAILRDADFKNLLADREALPRVVKVFRFLFTETTCNHLIDQLGIKI